MALVLANRVQETTTTTGTGTVTLAGAMSGFQSFAVVGNTNTTYYAITSGTDWEVGIGTYSTTGPTLARTTILSSSIGGGAITLAGTSIVFATYPSEKSVNYDASSNVGIGTTSPGAKLDVVGQARASTIYATSSTASSFVTRLTNQDFQIYATNGVSTGNSGDVKATIGLYYADTLANLNGGIQFTRGGAGTDGWLNFLTSGTERMRIDASGNVGIGISSPGLPLNVTKNGTDTGLGYSNVSKFVDGSGNKGLLVGYDNSAQTTVLTANSTSASSNMTFWTYEAGGSGWAERMRVTAAGNLGIGTSSPGYKLVVSAASNTNPIAVISGSTKGIRLGADANGGIIEGVDNTGAASYQPMTLGGADIRLTTSSTERMRITSSGSVGIGKTPAFGLLDVNGAIFATDDGTYSFGRNNGANSGGWKFDSTNPSIVTYVGNGSERMRIDSSGNVTIAKKIIPNVQSVASASTITPNADSDTQVSVTALAVPATIAAPSGTPSDGQSLVIRIEDDGTARALTWTTGSSGAYRAVGITLPTTTVAAKVVYIGCKYNSTDLRWDAIALSQEA